MSPRDLIQRKFEQKWSDGQLLVLMSLAQHGDMRLRELVCETRMSTSGTWKCLLMCRDQGCIATRGEKRGNKTYRLSPSGTAALRRIFQ